MIALDHLTIFAFAFAYPTYAFIGYANVKRALEANTPGARTRDYKETVIWLWSLSIFASLVWLSSQRPWRDLGIHVEPSWPLWIGLGLVGLIATVGVVQHRTIARDDRQRRKLRKTLQRMSASDYLPRSGTEARWFVGLSVTAGICEELLYRGFLMWYLEAMGGLLVSVIGSSVLFGAAHLYQGWKGSLRTGAVGLALALIYLVTGSLWVPMLLHIAGDVHSGMLGRIAFNEQNEAH